MRIWHGMTAAIKADEYREFLIQRAIPDYRSIVGNLSAAVVMRMDGGEAHFLTISTWDSEESIRAFAGEDIETARYYPEDKDFLLEFEPNVLHYEVAGIDGGSI